MSPTTSAAWRARWRRRCGRATVGVFTFYFVSVLSLKPSVPHDVQTVAPLAGAENAWVRAQQGLASFYARYFDGRRTASGARFDNRELVAAHPTYPFGTVVRVTNLVNGRSVKVRIVDRGPARGPRRVGVVIDLSRAAAAILDFVAEGRTRVRLDVLRSDRGRAGGRRTEAEAGRSNGSGRSPVAGSPG